MSTVTRQPMLDALKAKEAELQILVDEARTRIAEYPDQLHEARSRAIYAKPNVRPGVELNSEVSKLNAKEKKDVAALRGLEGDLSALRSILSVEAKKATEEATAEARRLLAERHELEQTSWEKAGSVFAELAEAWNKYVTIAEESIDYASSNGLDASAALAVAPAPASFKEFVALLLSASTDEDVRSAPHTEQIVDSGVFGRRGSNGEDLGGAVFETRVIGTRTLETRKKLDERDILYRVIPDLRSVVRVPKS